MEHLSEIAFWPTESEQSIFSVLTADTDIISCTDIPKEQSFFWLLYNQEILRTKDKKNIKVISNG